MERDNAVDVRRQEFVRLREEVREMRAAFQLEENDPINKLFLLKRVATAMGIDPAEVFKN